MDGHNDIELNISKYNWRNGLVFINSHCMSQRKPGTFMRSIGVFFVVSPNEMLNKELCGQLNETP